MTSSLWQAEKKKQRAVVLPFFHLTHRYIFLLKIVQNTLNWSKIIYLRKMYLKNAGNMKKKEPSLPRPQFLRVHLLTPPSPQGLMCGDVFKVPFKVKFTDIKPWIATKMIHIHFISKRKNHCLRNCMSPRGPPTAHFGLTKAQKRESTLSKRSTKTKKTVGKSDSYPNLWHQHTNFEELLVCFCLHLARCWPVTFSLCLSRLPCFMPAPVSTSASLSVRPPQN